MSASGPTFGAAVPARLPGIVPAWGAPANVGAFVTTRLGGVSAGRFGAADGAASGLNLGEHVGDDPAAVRENRARLAARLPGRVRWLQQVHGVAVHDADTQAEEGADPAGGQAIPIADAAVCTRPGTVLAIMTADCLPILLADPGGRMVGAAHAGWRGLAAGVVEATVDAMRARLGAQAPLLAWLGPAIGPRSFEVGEDVRAAFCDPDAAARAAFEPGDSPGKWRADLYRLARLRLAARGILEVTGGDRCTVLEPRHFYSHRRDRSSGRMASLVWLVG
jgi:YfiH family protein